jgi:hypothetical protein
MGLYSDRGVIFIISIHAKYPFCLWIPAPHIVPSLQAEYASRIQICSVPSSSRRPDLADRNSRTLSLISKRTLPLPPTPSLLRKEVRIPQDSTAPSLSIALLREMSLPHRTIVRAPVCHQRFYRLLSSAESKKKKRKKARYKAD